MRKSLFIATALVPLALGTRAACGCGDEPGAVVSDAGLDRLVNPDSGLDIGSDALPLDPACGVPGYQLDVGYKPECGFCYAATKAALPSPIRWEDCGHDVTPKGLNCKKMVFDWEPASVPNGFTPQYIRAGNAAVVKGAVVLGIERLTANGAFHIVADADGDVRQSIFEAQSMRCQARLPPLHAGPFGPGRACYAISELLPDGGQLGGAIGGSYDTLQPEVNIRHTDEANEDFTASDLGLLELAVAKAGTLRRYDWTGNLNSTLYVGADHGYALAYVQAQDRALFWDAYVGLALQKEMVWTEDAGAADFLSFGPDSSQGASSLGTDGVDIVWHYGSQRAQNGTWFPKNDIMTSPYTTDPSQLKPKRLRSDGINLTDHFVVGCGFAAHEWTLDPNGLVGGVLVVRIADGRSWTLTPTLGAPWIYSLPIAITCSELFTFVASNGVSNVARIRLDSLGTGDPPD